MRPFDIVPDWVIVILAVLVVGGVFKLFGGFGVLVLAIISTTVWIAQIMVSTRSVRDQDGRTNVSPSIADQSAAHQQLGRQRT
jgi:hypothetical protein